MHVYFGGSFDPPHLGHHEMLQALLADDWVSQVHLVPTGRNPHKPQEMYGSREDRIRWMDLWTREFPRERLLVETRELETEGPHYTVDTLAFLQKRTPGAWALCVGGDIPASLHRWKEVQGLLKYLHSVWVFTRGGQADPLAELAPELKSLCEFRRMAVDVPEISSTEIRSLCDSDNALQKIANAPLLPSIREDLARLIAR